MCRLQKQGTVLPHKHELLFLVSIPLSSLPCFRNWLLSFQAWNLPVDGVLYNNSGDGFRLIPGTGTPKSRADPHSWQSLWIDSAHAFREQLQDTTQMRSAMIAWAILNPSLLSLSVFTSTVTRIFSCWRRFPFPSRQQRQENFLKTE